MPITLSCGSWNQIQKDKGFFMHGKSPSNGHFSVHCFVSCRYRSPCIDASMSHRQSGTHRFIILRRWCVRKYRQVSKLRRTLVAITMFADHTDGLSSSSFSLILDSSVGLSAGIQSAGDLVSETLMGSNPAFSRGRQIVSLRFEYRLPVPEHRN